MAPTYLWRVLGFVLVVVKNDSSPPPSPSPSGNVKRWGFEKPAEGSFSEVAMSINLRRNNIEVDHSAL